MSERISKISKIAVWSIGAGVGLGLLAEVVAGGGMDVADHLVSLATRTAVLSHNGMGNQQSIIDYVLSQDQRH